VQKKKFIRKFDKAGENHSFDGVPVKEIILNINEWEPNG